MKLWLLRPADKLADDNNPWSPWYDKAFGFVVAAPSENDARIIADRDAGDENRGSFYDGRKWEGNPWLKPHLSTCVELRPENFTEPGVVLKDFAAA